MWWEQGRIVRVSLDTSYNNLEIAFSVGIAERLNEAEVLVERFLHDQKISATNHERCEVAARGLILGEREALYPSTAKQHCNGKQCKFSRK